MQIVENIRHYPIFMVGALIFLSVGFVTLVWAERVQQWTIRWHEQHPALAKLNLFRRRIYGDWYTVELRLCGIFSISGGILCCWALWFGK